MEGRQNNCATYHSDIISKHPTTDTCQGSKYVDSRVARLSRDNAFHDLCWVWTHGLRHLEQQKESLDYGALNAIGMIEEVDID